MPKPIVPLSSVSNNPSLKNCHWTLRGVAPSALRMPSSRVRSLTEMSMMFITPMPPSASVIKTDGDEKLVHAGNHFAEEDRFERRVPHRNRFTILWIKAVFRRQDRSNLVFDRPTLFKIEFALRARRSASPLQSHDRRAQR